MKISLKAYVIFFALLLGFFILAMSRFTPKTITPIQETNVIDESMHGVNMYRYNTEGQLTQHLKMKSWQRLRGETVTDMISPSLRVFYKNGTWDVSADTGKGYQDNAKGPLKKLHLISNVKINKLALNHGAPWEMQTKNLWFFPDTTLAQTDEPVLIIGPQMQISALGVRSYLNKHSLEFVNNVQTRYSATVDPNWGKT